MTGNTYDAPRTPGIRAMLRLTACFASLLLAACSTMPTAPPSPLEFVVVRHAEKMADAGDDPSLTASGLARADAVARSLAGAPVVAVYSTAYARTRQTAAPTASAHGVPVTTYDAREPASMFAARLRAAHDSGTVLVVGHSNTVPAIAAALCGCDVPPMDETEYDRQLVVTVDAEGDATLATSRMPPTHAP